MHRLCFDPLPKKKKKMTIEPKDSIERGWWHEWMVNLEIRGKRKRRI